MFPILSGKEILIPLFKGELVTNKKMTQIAPSNEIVTNKKMAQIAPFDFWKSIERLAWVDREDSRPPTVNPARPSIKWSQLEWQSAQNDGAIHVAALAEVLESEDFWFRNKIADSQQLALCWHIVARGREMYTAIMSDAEFAVGSIGQDCGFHEFIATWS